MELPTSLPTVILQRILRNSEAISSEAAKREMQSRYPDDSVRTQSLALNLTKTKTKKRIRMMITNDKNIIKKNFPLAEKFFGFAEKTEKFL
jgi:hypothetical protein